MAVKANCRTLDSALQKSSDQTVSMFTQNRINRVEAETLDPGVYYLPAQKHFNVDVQYDGQKYVSSRLAAATDDGRSCNIKINTLLDSAFVGDIPELTMADCETRDGLLRVKRGILPRPTKACQLRIPLYMDDKGNAVLEESIKITVKGPQDAWKVSYVQNSTGKYDVEINDDNNVVTNATTLYAYEWEPANAADAKKAKKAIEADSQLSTLARLD